MSLYLDIKKNFKNFTLDIQIENHAKQLGILGASGCGKSMTLKCIAGLEKPDHGKIILNNRVLFDSDKKINITPQNRKIGYLFQNYALFPHMTVNENISIAMNKSLDKKALTAKMISTFHLNNLEDKYPPQLSGGQQQRVALARILAYEPEVLLLDEPFSALDSFLKEQLQQEMLEILKDYPGEIIMVSHSRDELYRFSKQLAIIREGHLSAIDSTYNIFHNPKNVTAARLTGCKNISKIIKLSNFEVLAVDWNVKLRTEYVSDDIEYIGIRAHDIQLGMDETKENNLDVYLYGISESPFENNLILSFHKDPSNCKNIWWKVSKNYWDNTLRKEMPKRIHLPKENIMLLQEDIFR